MLKTFSIAVGFSTMMALAIPVSACEFHGPGFSSYGIPGANWAPYNPESYLHNPAVLNQSAEETAIVTPSPKNLRSETISPETKLSVKAQSTKRSRPSFSNAANRAASLAKARTAQKVKDRAVSTSKDR